MQRVGLNGVLRCHKIDLEVLSYLDVLTLGRFLSKDAEILPRKQTGLCARCQRKVAKTVKRARHFGILPHLGEFIVQDNKVSPESAYFHELQATTEFEETELSSSLATSSENKPLTSVEVTHTSSRDKKPRRNLPYVSKTIL